MHGPARDFFRTVAGNTRLITSNYVIGESITWLTYRRGRQQALTLHSMVNSALETNLLSLEWVTPEVHDHAWSLYERFHDKLFSFCDCTSFAVCQSLGVDFVFGFDRDFQAAGFDLRP